MPEELAAEIAERAATRNISAAGADFLITGRLWTNAPAQEGVNADAAAVRAGESDISPTTAAFLLARKATQGLGMLATAVKPIRL